MTKTQLLNQFSAQPEQRLLLARLLDKWAMTQERSVASCSGFLSPEEQVQVEALLKRLPPVQHLFFGGYPGSERQVCAFLPDWMDPEDWMADEACPVCALEAEVPPLSNLNHRDYLGSLMGLGLTREKIGDILPRDGGCRVVILREVRPILLDQWEKTARYSVKLRPAALTDLAPAAPKVKNIRATVASLRLDAVLAAGFSIPRSRGAELVEAGRVLRNHQPCGKADKAVEVGDVFSCRGLGKFVLTRAEGKSRKGRIIIEMDRYV